MLRYLERSGLVIPRRTRSGYRVYELRELNQLVSLRGLRRRFGVELSELVFVGRLRREPELRAAVDAWFAGGMLDALDWDQRKQERLLAA
jgi:MerR family copper efflux transcriptional regulator